MIVVFISNKLISCDNIAPLLVEIKARSPEQEIDVLCFDWKTFYEIQKNQVLMHLITRVGNFECLLRDRNKESWIAHRARAFKKLFSLSVNAILGHARFVHFKHLAYPPLRFLYLLNRNRTIYMESDPLGYSKSVAKMGVLKRVRNNAPTRAAGALFGFNEDWPQAAAAREEGRTVAIAPPFKSLPFWRAEVEKIAPSYLQSITPEPKKDEKFITFLLGGFNKFDFMADQSSMRGLFEETLDILDRETGDVRILIKPHIITDSSILSECLKARSSEKYTVTYLHPSVLAVRSHFLLANYFSTALADAVFLGAPTVEYARYSEAALTATGGGSMRPEYVDVFVNGDRSAFADAIRSIVAGRFTPSSGSEPGRPARDASVVDHLIEHLCGVTATPPGAPRDAAA